MPLAQFVIAIGQPIQDGTSLGVILMMGQISGVLFIYIFEVLQNAAGSVVWPMLFFVLLTIIELPMVLQMKESEITQ